MKTFLLLIFSFSIALARVVSAEDQDQVKNKPKGHAGAMQTSRHVAPPQTVAKAPHVYRNPAQTDPYHPKIQSKARVRTNPTIPNAGVPKMPPIFQKKPNVPNENWQHKNWQDNNNNPKATLQKKNRPNENWNNNSWAEARRRHHRDHHHRDWWRSRYSRFALFGTGYYFWDNGYWFPAYGYDPAYNSYAYDEPIYGYNDLEPAQVVASVQAQLQRLGYYRYAVDGQMGPMTRAAIANYQRDTGLSITAAIDAPTLESLGLR